MYVLQETEEAAPAGESEEAVGTDPSTQPAPESVAAAAGKKAAARMGFDEYKRLSNMLVLYMRQREEEEELSALGESCCVGGQEKIICALLKRNFSAARCGFEPLAFGFEAKALFS